MGFLSSLFGEKKVDAPKRGLDIRLGLDRISPKKQEALDKAVAFLNRLTSHYNFEAEQSDRSGFCEVKLVKEDRDPYHKIVVILELQVDEDIREKKFLSGIELSFDLMYDFKDKTVTAYVDGTVDKVIKEFSKHEEFLSTLNPE